MSSFANRLAALPPGDVFDRNCPSRDVVELLSDKWALLLLWSLGAGPARFGQLRRRLDGVTQKMLTQTLRSLERSGLVSRTVLDLSPPAVEYALTPLGESLTSISEQMCQWAETNMKGVLSARHAYDQLQVPADGVVKVVAGRRALPL